MRISHALPRSQKTKTECKDVTFFLNGASTKFTLLVSMNHYQINYKQAFGMPMHDRPDEVVTLPKKQGEQL